MEIILFVLFIFVSIYAYYIAQLVVGLFSIKKSIIKPSTELITFSIIVPFRDEANNLPRLLESIRLLDYPIQKFEIILINDFSEDDSVDMITKWRMNNGLLQTTVLENLLLTGSPKKDAINRAMPIIANEWVFTTDADCILPAGLLRSISALISERKLDMVVGAVAYDGNASFLHHFQRMDMLSLQGATIGGFGIKKPFICSGANFAYSRKFFESLNGFKGNSTIASGDDVFLLLKAWQKHPEKVGFNKSVDAIVTTKPVDSSSTLLHQRARWAAKSNVYHHIFAEDMAFAVFLGNVSMVIAFVLMLLKCISIEAFSILFLIKLIPDTILLYKTNRFLNSGKFIFPFFASLVYPFFICFVVTKTLTGKYTWKGRSFKM